MSFRLIGFIWGIFWRDLGRIKIIHLIMETKYRDSGTFILIMALASSYAADCTQDSERNVALGWF